jgi:hypothetical protein
MSEIILKKLESAEYFHKLLSEISKAYSHSNPHVGLVRTKETELKSLFITFIAQQINNQYSSIEEIESKEEFNKKENLQKRMDNDLLTINRFLGDELGYVLYSGIMFNEGLINNFEKCKECVRSITKYIEEYKYL